MQLINLTGKAQSVASTWNELTSRQVQHASLILHSQAMILEDVFFALLWVLSGLPGEKYKEAGPDQVYNSLPAVDFMWKGLTLTQNPLPRIRKWYWLRGLIGPADKLNNVTGREWAKTEKAMTAYFKTKDITKIEELIAVLWRPRNYFMMPWSLGFKNDLRVRYNEFLVARRMKKIAALSRGEKLAAFSFYLGCRKHFEKTWPAIFSGGENSKPSRYGWMQIYSAMEEYSISGMLKTADEPITVILSMLDMMDDEMIRVKNAENA